MFGAIIEELQLPSQQWRAIEIFEGPQALNQTGHISRYSEPLARDRVDLIYVSTYNTDLILVLEENVDRAVASLERVANVNVVIENPNHTSNTSKNEPKNLETAAISDAPESDDVETLGISMSSPATAATNLALRAPKFMRQEHIDQFGGSSEDAHILAQLPANLNLINFKASQVALLAHSLLQVFLFPSSEERFFSYTSYGGDVTLIIDESEIGPLMPHMAVLTRHDCSWNALHLQASPDGIDSSVVNYAAKVLAKNEVSIYYLSTMNDDYILVPNKSITMALDSLQTTDL